MIRRAARVLVLLALGFIFVRDLVQLNRYGRRVGAAFRRTTLVAPTAAYLDQYCIVVTAYRPYLPAVLSGAALLAVLPRPRLYKVVLLTALQLVLHLSSELAPIYHARRGPITLANGTVVFSGVGWGTGLSWETYAWIQLLLIRSTLLAWTLWFLQPRPSRSGHCPRCDYSLTGAVSERCPECGTHLSPPAVSSNL